MCRICAAITEGGRTVEADDYVAKRDRQTRKVRGESLAENLSYDAAQLDRTVAALSLRRAHRARQGHLDIFWLRDEALEQFSEIVADVGKPV